MKRRGFLAGLVTAFAAASVPTATFAGVIEARPRLSNLALIAKADAALAEFGGVLSASQAERFMALVCDQSTILTTAKIVELDRPLSCGIGSHAIGVAA